MDEKRLAIKDLEEIRKTGDFNLLAERKAVLQYANRKNMFNLIAYVENDVEKYLDLIIEMR